MPPRRSQREKRPSSRLAGTSSASKRSSRAGAEITEPVQTESSAEHVGISPELIGQIVTQVTAAISKNISSLLPHHHTTNTTTRPNELLELPLSPPNSGSTNNIASTAVNIVQESIAATHAVVSGTDLPAAGTSAHESAANRDSSPSAASELGAIVSSLMQSSLQPSSLPTYRRAWKLFTEFHTTVFSCAVFNLPISPPNLALFIAYMHNRQYAPSTVNTYTSAIGYFHKLQGFPDPTKVFYIIQMLKGYNKLGFRLDSRLPITLPILHRLLGSSAQLTGSRYQVCLFQAMCSLAFSAFLRVGEITVTSSRASSPPLEMSQVTQLLDTSKMVAALKITFLDYKHNYNQRPFSLVIYRQQVFCPVQIILDYLALRGYHSGPIFQTIDKAPVLRTFFTNQLSIAIQLCGLDPTRYKGHSFRIGAASHAADRGMSDGQIRTLGLF